MENVEQIRKLDLAQIPAGTIKKYRYHIISDGLGSAINVPIIIAKGAEEGPILGLTAAMHGNELNGIPVIQRIFRNINPSKLKGTIIGVPVLNVPGFLRRSRKFNDDFDLNKKMPGRKNGNRSDVYAFRIFEEIIKQFNYLIDLHTASSGRTNSYYIRADLQDPLIKKLALLQNAEIVLDNKGSKGTLRKAAAEHNIPAITVELGDPHRFQKDIIKASIAGIQNTLKFLKMIQGNKERSKKKPIICKDSYWMYTESGGVLAVMVKLTEKVKKDQIIARVRDIFGEVIEEYKAPEDGVIIGRSVDPVNQTGSRIIHLGLFE